MNNARKIGLDTCKEKFCSIISVSQLEMSEGTTIELSNEDAYFFRIMWKLEPSTKHFAKVKNVCRLACTADGNYYSVSFTNENNPFLFRCQISEGKD